MKRKTILFLAAAALSAACGANDETQAGVRATVESTGESTTTGPEQNSTEQPGTETSQSEATPQVTPDGPVVDPVVEDPTTTTPADPQPTVVSVMTMNLWNAYLNRDQYDERTQLVVDEINLRQPDLVALQENVSSRDIEDRAAAIAAATGYELVAEQTHSVPFVFDEGIAVLTRLPLLSADSRELPHRDLFAVERKALVVEVSTDAGPVTLIATHMMVEPDQAKKADQARELAATAQSLTTPVFLAGDLNAEPDTDAMRLLRGEIERDGMTGPFVDAWTTVRPTDAGFTHPSDEPAKRIDYIYAAPGGGQTLDVQSCERVLDQATNGLLASDHAGVFCTFTL